MAMSGQEAGTDRWVRRLAVRPRRRVRLICFHHAGGSAAAFRDWPPLLDESIEPVAVQLPGRENRFTERPYTDTGLLVDRLVEVLEPVLDEPFACFGHSMGARVAFAFAQRLHALGHPTPEMLLVAGSPGPALPVRVPGWDRTDEELIRYVRDGGGVPPEVLADTDLLEMMVPTIRADLTVVATWPYRPRPPLPCPIRAFAGTSDDYASPDRMRAWERETAASFALEAIPGGHFFPRDERRSLVAAINRELAGVARAAAGGNPPGAA